MEITPIDQDALVVQVYCVKYAKSIGIIIVSPCC